MSEVKEALQILMDTVLNLIQEDPHQWSERPCSTCQAISSIVGRPFGCYLYARQRRERRDREEKNSKPGKP